MGLDPRGPRENEIYFTFHTHPFTEAEGYGEGAEGISKEERDGSGVKIIRDRRGYCIVGAGYGFR